MLNSPKSKRVKSSLKVTIIYVLVGSLWVILSDRLINMLKFSEAISVNSSKGLFYVIITAFILYFCLKRLKKQLIESEERYGILVEHSPEPIVVHSDGIIVFINPAGARVLGANCPEELIGQSVINFVHPDFVDISFVRMKQITVDRQPTEPMDQKFLRIDQHIIDVEVREVPIVFLGKPAVQLLCRDITERKRAQCLLEEREQSYKSLVEHNPDAIFTLDLKGNVQTVNPATEKITGYGEEEFQNRVFIPFLIEDDHEKAWCQFEKAVMGEANDTEITLTNKAGKNVELNLKMVPIILNDKIDGVYGIVKDITERKRTEELLLKSEKLSIVGQLAAGVAHEIRNPLTSLRGFVQLLQSKVDNYQYYFQIMLSELDRINDIVSEFMVIAKPQAVNYEMKDIRKIVDDVMSLLDTQAILNNVQIHTEIAAGIPAIKCEENQLKQVFINILKNAIEAMPDGGNIVIALETDDNKIRIRFIDEGCGISEERIVLLGEPFYTTKEKGTGLGLMVCHKIIEAHRGHLEIKSVIDKGTTVEILLPISAS
ncbi:PAS domain-containing sensor histidine kinase [Paenibacillus aceris]|uniref:histidine kinase n=1 Tax=Paenibacillus aceris TaxID=869555 RepID=A0ABS4I205_9BACL|nr:PAS domain S-box protein [Paenibacillus aceris]MBP1964461.1 PAS domain S-box-containing protein [Paenibacillus aceris]NHW35826.1 PAS domain S-box protein [Paenibacillus aceris]